MKVRDESSLQAEEIERALIRVQSGDPEAYGVVVTAYQSRLRSFIAGYVPRAEWVDDLAQQTFVSAYQSLSGFRVGTDFYAWLRQIAYNHLRAELERTGRRRRLEREYLFDMVAEELSARLERESGEKDEDLDRLRDCMTGLSDTARWILQRYYGDGSPLSEVAAELGRTPESLKVSLFKIRARLKGCLEYKADCGRSCRSRP